MQFKIDQRIFTAHPELMIGIVVVHDAFNTISPPNIQQLLVSEELRRFKEITPNVLARHPHLTVWRDVYRSFGAKPKEHFSSLEALLQRIAKSEQVRQVNLLVDLYNTISLRYLLPAGGEDLDTIDGDIELTIAGDHEEPVLLLGQQEARAPVAGEIIYRDVQGAICRRFNWKESARTQLTTKTRNALFVFEALPPVSREIVVAAINDLAALIEQYAHGQVSIDILDAHNPAVLLKSEKKYLTLQPHTTIPEDIVISLSAPNMNLQESAKLDLGIQSAAEKTLSHGTVPLDESHIRIGKVQELRKQNIEPWPHAEQVTGTAEQVHKEYDADIQRSYALAGRIMSCRAHGKAIFIHIQDQTGRMQLYIKQDVVGEETFSRVKHFFDIGDIIWAQGYAFKTKTGEITLHVERCLLLSKSLHPLPEKFHGLTDVEVRYRQRYLDLITHQEVRERFIKRSSILRLLRSYLDAHDFLEVETPMLHPIPGGAAARPFVTHHNTLDSDFYLRIAPELYLKRLVIGGFERVYEINRNFRNEGVSTRHNPEFTMLEFYWAHRDYHFIMQFLESMIKDIVMKVCGTLSIPFGDYDLDFSAPFDRLNVHQILMKYGNFTKEQLSEEVLDDTLRTANVKVINKSSSYAQKLFLLFEETCEKKIIQPTFLIDFPIEISPLAKRDVHNPSLAARFELFIAGMEISNGFNELNDPFDQAERFKEQVQAHTAGDEEAHHYDADYITALEYGLPPTVGVGIGIDRLIMLLTNTTSIKEVILFPTLKRKA